ncbi:MAG: hypothetical protein AAF614_41995 [Chloroflexota bacterium]
MLAIILHGQLGYMDEVAWVVGVLLLTVVLVATAVSHWREKRPLDL